MAEKVGKCGNENNSSLFGMTYITWKERQTNGQPFGKDLKLEK